MLVGRANKVRPQGSAVWNKTKRRKLTLRTLMCFVSAQLTSIKCTLLPHANILMVFFVMQCWCYTHRIQALRH